MSWHFAIIAQSYSHLTSRRVLKSKNRLHLKAAAKCVMFHRVTVDATSLWELMVHHC